MYFNFQALIVSVIVTLFDICSGLSIGNSGVVAATKDLSITRKDTDKMIATSNLLKRQGFIYASRRAVVWYECPISGPQVKVFQWAARYNTETYGMTLHGQENIDSWDHVQLAANNFACKFHHQVCRGYRGHCCIHSFEAVVLGTLLEHDIDMTLVTPFISWEDRVKVTELCVSITGDLMCVQQTCPVQVVYHRDCHVTNTVVSIA